MILAKLVGGLSNQMFQYAAALRLAAKHATSVGIDTSWFDHVPAGATPRTYGLHNLRITGTRATHWQTIGTNGLRQTPVHELPVALYRVVRPRYRLVRERHFHFDPDVLQLSDGVCLLGYWHSERYFADVAELVRNEFHFLNEPCDENALCAERLAQSNSVAIHVRRGDYASNPTTNAYHGLCGIDYYNQAVEYMQQRVSDPQFFVFSDDLDWARDNLTLGGDAEFVDHNHGDASQEDLRLMSLARHNIIANSSFSWWGAWLNQNESKIVVAPKRWVNDPSINTSDLLPPAWIAI
jgi:hypothetical protein